MVGMDTLANSLEEVDSRKCMWAIMRLQVGACRTYVLSSDA